METTRTPVEALKVGSRVSGEIYRLKTLTKGKNGYQVTIADSSGELDGELPAERWDETYKLLVGGAVRLNGIITTKEDSLPYLKVRSFAKAEAGSYKASELFSGLTPEDRKRYISTIQMLGPKIPDEGVRKLAGKVLSNELKSLSAQPATLGTYGKGIGGALAATATIARMAAQSCVAYRASESPSQPLAIDWSVLLGASLLYTAGIPLYYTKEPPFQISEYGVQAGYVACTRKVILDTAKREQIEISEPLLERLLNAIASAVPNSSLSSTGPEGKVLRSAVSLYSQLDQMAAGLAEEDFGQRNYTYMHRVGYVTPQTPEDEKNAAAVAAKKGEAA